MSLPLPTKTTFNFHRPGSLIRNPYTGEILQQYVYSPRDLLQVTYMWDAASTSDAKEISAIISKRRNIYEWEFYVSNRGDFKHNTSLNAATIEINNADVVLEADLEGFNLKHGDWVQIGKYPLEIASVSESGRRGGKITWGVAFSNAPPLRELDTSVVFKTNSGYTLNARRETLDRSYVQETIRVSRPSSITLLEVS